MGFLLSSTYLRQSGGRYCSVGSLLCTDGVSCTCSCKARLPFAHPGCTGLPWKWWEISTLEMDKRKSVRRQNIFGVHSKGIKKKCILVLWTLFSLLFKCEVPIMFGILKIIVIFSSINFFKYVVIITHITPYHRHLERQKHCTHTWTQAMTKPIAWSMKGTNKKAIAFKYITADCQPAHIIQNAPVIQHETRAQRLRAFIHMGKY